MNQHFYSVKLISNCTLLKAHSTVKNAFVPMTCVSAKLTSTATRTILQKHTELLLNTCTYHHGITSCRDSTNKDRQIWEHTGFCTVLESESDSPRSWSPAWVRFYQDHTRIIASLILNVAALALIWSWPQSVLMAYPIWCLEQSCTPARRALTSARH